MMSSTYVILRKVDDVWTMHHQTLNEKISDIVMESSKGDNVVRIIIKEQQSRAVDTPLLLPYAVPHMESK